MTKGTGVLRSRNYDTSNTGGIYVIVEEGTTQPCKIGWALRLYHRRHGLNVGNPRLLVVVGNVLVERLPDEPELRYRARGMACEEAVHLVLKDSKVRGEWFSIDSFVAVSLIEKMTAKAAA